MPRVGKVSKLTSFDGDLADEDTVREKLAEVEEKIEEQERLRETVEDDLDRLQRLRQGLLVLVGDKEPESEKARTERLELKRKQSEQWRAAREMQAEAATIQAQVEQVVNLLNEPVSASDVLDCVPGAKREAVNYALWRADKMKRIRRVSHGVYAPLTTPQPSSTEGG